MICWIGQRQKLRYRYRDTDLFLSFFCMKPVQNKSSLSPADNRLATADIISCPWKHQRSGKRRKCDFHFLCSGFPRIAETLEVMILWKGKKTSHPSMHFDCSSVSLCIPGDILFWSCRVVHFLLSPTVTFLFPIYLQMYLQTGWKVVTGNSLSRRVCTDWVVRQMTVYLWALLDLSQIFCKYIQCIYIFF